VICYLFSSRLRLSANSRSVVDDGGTAGVCDAGGPDWDSGFADVVGLDVVERGGIDPVDVGSGRSSRFDLSVALTDCFVCKSVPIVAVTGARFRRVIARQIPAKSI
jgi:hypothetical protein